MYCTVEVIVFGTNTAFADTVKVLVIAVALVVTVAAYEHRAVVAETPEGRMDVGFILARRTATRAKT